MRYIAFLRAINVGGHTVKMDRLRQLFVNMGFTNVETFIASGNVIFEARSSDVDALEARIERALEKALGYEVGTFVRSCADVAAIADTAPAPPRGGRCHVVFMKSPCAKPTKDELSKLRSKDDDFHHDKRELFWTTRGSFSQSPVAVPFGKLVGRIGTMRSVTTVRKLSDKYKP